MDVVKLIDLLLRKEELKDVSIEIISKVVFSVFDVLAHGKVFYEE